MERELLCFDQGKQPGNGNSSVISFPAPAFEDMMDLEKKNVTFQKHFGSNVELNSASKEANE